MNLLILIAVVGILGNPVLYWVPRTVIASGTEAALSSSVVATRLRARVATGGELATMVAHKYKGALGAEWQPT